MKKFSKALVAGVLATSMMLFAGCGGNDAAQNADADAQETVVLTVGTNAAFEPFEMMSEDGYTPDVFSSSNVDGGDEINNAFIEKYKKEIKSL